MYVIFHGSHDDRLNTVLIDCEVNYHHNYCVEKGKRIYYSGNGIPEILQVGEHQFAERKLVQLWVTMMLVSWYVSCYSMGYTNDMIDHRMETYMLKGAVGNARDGGG